MRMPRRQLVAWGAAGAVLGAAPVGAHAQTTAELPLRLVPVATGLANPWAVAFLPDGVMLTTERRGRLRAWRRGTAIADIGGLPPIWAQGQGGLLDLCLHPEFVTTRTLYLSYAARTEEGAATRIARARLDENLVLRDVTPIFEAGPRIANGFHFGCRLAFAPDGMLHATTGDRFAWRDAAQDLTDLRGKTVRLREDGGIPADNPFIGRADARPEIFTYGHRNPQGLAVDPVSGALWSHEHGPRGGDEINRLVAGGNFGWPRATHGVEYSGATITEHRTLPGMRDPLWVWVPSIAPSGMAFCTSALYPGWRGSLLVGALVGQGLLRLDIGDGRVIREERVVPRAAGRIRDVRQGPDGRIYVATDATEGAVLRLDLA